MLSNYGFCLEENERETVKLRLQLGASHWLQSFAPKLTRSESSPGFEIGLQSMTTEAKQLFSLLRLMQFADSEFAKLHPGVRGADVCNIPILDLKNEIGALQRLVQECERRLSHYPGTAEDDRERLSDPSLTSNQRMALIYRLSQRRMTDTVRKNATLALDALSSQGGDRAAALKEAASRSDGWIPYFQVLSAVLG